MKLYNGVLWILLLTASSALKANWSFPFNVRTLFGAGVVTAAASYVVLTNGEAVGKVATTTAHSVAVRCCQIAAGLVKHALEFALLTTAVSGTGFVVIKGRENRTQERLQQVEQHSARMQEELSAAYRREEEAFRRSDESNRCVDSILTHLMNGAVMTVGDESGNQRRYRLIPADRSQSPEAAPTRHIPVSRPSHTVPVGSVDINSLLGHK